jgi:tetratricopeptide (TPR) repeat protein
MVSVSEAYLRHATHYETVARTADEFYLQGGYMFKHGLTMFGLEWENIKAAQAWVKHHSHEDATVAKLCGAFPIAAPYCLDSYLSNQERIEWLETGLDAVRRLNDRASEGRILGDLGLCYASLGQIPYAIELQRQRLDISREVGDRRGEGVTLNNLGRAYYSLALLEGYNRQFQRGALRKNAYILRGIECSQRALAISRECDDRLNEASALSNLGRMYAFLHLYQRAIKYFERGLASACEAGQYFDQIQILFGLSGAYKELNDNHRAIEYLEQALTIDRELGNARGEASVIGAMGAVYGKIDNYRQAVKLFQEQLSIYRRFNDRRGESGALMSTGFAYRRLRDYHRAIEYFEQALAIRQETGDRFTEGSTLCDIGLAYLWLCNKQKASEYLKRGREILNEFQLPMSPIIRVALIFLMVPEFLLPLFLLLYKALANIIPVKLIRRQLERILERRISQGDLPWDLDNLTQAIELEPTKAKHYFKRGYIYHELKNYPAAITDFLRAVELDPNNPWYYDDIAMVYEEQGDHTLAMDYYNKALKIKPNNSAIRSNRGLVHFELGNYTEALADFSNAIQHKPKRARYYSHRALAFYCLGEYGKAQRDFEKSLALHPDNNVFCDLAKKSILENDVDEVIINLRKAFELDREDTLVYITEDSCFESIRGSEQFQALLKEFKD